MPVTVLESLVDLVLPRLCVLCGGAGSVLCRGCAPPPAPLKVGGGFDVTAAGEYAGGLRQALIAYKERGRRDLAGVLGAYLSVALASLLGDLDRRSVVLVTVPSSRRAVAARGGDHVRRLARRAGVRAGVRPAGRVLRPTREILDSAGLGVLERADNLAGALRAAPAVGRAAVIVDDIVTTGTTLREARRALLDAGWHVHGAAVVAATPSPAARPTHHADTADPLAVPRSSV